MSSPGDTHATDTLSKRGREKARRKEWTPNLSHQFPCGSVQNKGKGDHLAQMATPIIVPGGKLRKKK